MSCCSRKPALLVSCVAFVALCASQAFTHGNEHQGGDAESATGHSHAASQLHGGEVVMTQDHHFEVSFTPTAMRVHVYDGQQKPVSAKGVTGDASISLRTGGAERVPLRYVAATAAEADHLEGAYAFQPLKPGSAKVSVQLAGLKGSEATASFKTTFTGISKPRAPGATGSTHDDHHEHGASADQHSH